MADELDDLLNELKNAKNPQPSPEPEKKREEVNDENINDYILRKASELIDTGMFTVEAMKNSITSAYEPEEIESYATLIKSVNDTIETLNKINIQNKKAKTSKEIKQMGIDAQAALGPAQHNTNNNILIATREEIMKNLIEPMLDQTNDKPNKVINVTEEEN